jgi:hypothetical protein
LIASIVSHAARAGYCDFDTDTQFVVMDKNPWGMEKAIAVGGARH